MTRCTVCPKPCREDCPCRCHPRQSVLCAHPGCMTRFPVKRSGPFPALCPDHQRATNYLVRRLAYLAHRRVRDRDKLNHLGIRLLDHAIRATVMDCTDFGRGRDAGEIVQAMTFRLAAGGSLE